MSNQIFNGTVNEKESKIREICKSNKLAIRPARRDECQIKPKRKLEILKAPALVE